MIPRSSGAHLNPPAWIVFKEIFIRTVAADTGKQFCNSRRLSEAQYKRNTILTRGLSSAALAKEEARKLHKWSVEERLHKRNEMERLHPPSHKATVDKQARLLEFGEDVPASFHCAVARKKRLCFLSEVVPDGTVK